MFQVRLAAFIAVLMLVLAGPSFADRRRPHSPAGPLELLRIPEVQRELKLEDSQIEQINQVGQELIGRSRETFRNFQSLTPEERDRRRQEFINEWMRKVGEVLDARQMARLKQLGLQREGVRAVFRRDIADELRLSPEQRQRVQTIMEGEREDFRKMFEGFRAGGSMTPGQRGEIARRFREARAATDSQINAVLTEGQRRQFQGMLGVPFRFPEPPRRP